ncbi:hypothetical protein FB45DRAFT_26275 [Roridomyces roridus]|uniref:Uncharacterized protein n=1 Tax=Roridomyces roridus TaxID=1738132 RepID=A0AAD7CJY8_9AGAR|nr:hypothetical protein FB45DRAFT_26275 [Roridomyces roridus]
MATLAQRSSSSLANAIHHPRMSSLPNSDLWTLKSTTTTVSAAPSRPVTRRVVAVCTSRKRPTQTLAHIQVSLPPPQPYQVGRATVFTSTAPPVDTFSFTNTPIGLGHPSTSARRTAPTASQSLAPLPRINSSTMKPRSKRFPGRELHVIEEEHLNSDSLLSTHTDIPAPRAPTVTSSIQRLVSPTPGFPKATVDIVPSAAVLNPTPRFTSSGAPQAGPNQVQSPRVLMPATMAGSPWFQSLDGAVHSMILEEVENQRAEEEEATVEVEEWHYKEDILLKWKFHLGMRIRFMLGRWKIPHF